MNIPDQESQAVVFGNRLPHNGAGELSYVGFLMPDLCRLSSSCMMLFAHHPAGAGQRRCHGKGCRDRSCHTVQGGRVRCTAPALGCGCTADTALVMLSLTLLSLARCQAPAFCRTGCALASWEPEKVDSCIDCQNVLPVLQVRYGEWTLTVQPWWALYQTTCSGCSTRARQVPTGTEAGGQRWVVVGFV